MFRCWISLVAVALDSIGVAARRSGPGSFLTRSAAGNENVPAQHRAHAARGTLPIDSPCFPRIPKAGIATLPCMLARAT